MKDVLAKQGKANLLPSGFSFTCHQVQCGDPVQESWDCILYFTSSYSVTQSHAIFSKLTDKGGGGVVGEGAGRRMAGNCCMSPRFQFKSYITQLCLSVWRGVADSQVMCCPNTTVQAQTALCIKVKVRLVCWLTPIILALRHRGRRTAVTWDLSDLHRSYRPARATQNPSTKTTNKNFNNRREGNTGISQSPEQAPAMFTGQFK